MPLTDPLRFAHSIMVGNLQFAATGSTLIPFLAQAHGHARLRPALPSLVFANCRLQWPLRLGLDQAAVQQAVSGLIDVAMLDKLWVMVIVGGYNSLVPHMMLQGHPDQRECLSQVNASMRG